MRETTTDLQQLQALLDASYASAGPHLSEIHQPRARLSAEEVAQRLTGMRVFVVATVSRDGRPFTGPVDGFLYRGAVHFGTSAHALRARHLRRSPKVSATYVEGETLVVTVHGQARPLDLRGEDAGFADLTREHYGQGWDGWEELPAAYAIDAEKMFAADMSVYSVSG